MSSSTNAGYCYWCGSPVRLQWGGCPYCGIAFVTREEYFLRRLLVASPLFLRQYLTNRNPRNDGSTVESSRVLESRIPITWPQDGGFEAISSMPPGLMATPGNQQVSANDYQGPPPASSSSINAIPSVTITREHLDSQTECPICQESFKVGSEVKEMPCKHMFDADCITLWLVQHNTCPVCREELPQEG